MKLIPKDKEYPTIYLSNFFTSDNSMSRYLKGVVVLRNMHYLKGPNY